MVHRSYRRHSQTFKFWLCESIRSGALGRREAKRLHALSDNLIHDWLRQYDCGALGVQPPACEAHASPRTTVEPADEPLRAARLAFYGALRTRVAHLLARMADHPAAHTMNARRARAQLDALLCHFIECLEHDDEAMVGVIAACLTVSDLVAIERATSHVTEDDQDALGLRLHHVGLVSAQRRPGERYAAPVRMYTTDAPGGIALQWHRFEPGSPLHPMLRTMPHVAFQACNLDVALRDATLILGPYEPIDGYRVAVIDDEGVLTELVETSLSRVQLRHRARSGEGSLYRK